MPFQKRPSRRHFTPAAQAAAIAARRRKREDALPKGTPEVFVVRRSSANLAFGWEIRRFGGVLIDSSPTDYPTLQEAFAAGETSLNGGAPGA